MLGPAEQFVKTWSWAATQSFTSALDAPNISINLFSVSAAVWKASCGQLRNVTYESFWFTERNVSISGDLGTSGTLLLASSQTLTQFSPPESQFSCSLSSQMELTAFCSLVSSPAPVK